MRKKLTALENAKAKRWTLSACFIALALIFIVLAFAFMNTMTDADWLQANVYVENTLTEMKVGDKIKYEDTHAEFRRLISSEERANHYPYRSQQLKPITEVVKEYNYAGEKYEETLSSENVTDRPVYIDEDGYLCAGKAGVYQLVYTLTQKWFRDVNGYHSVDHRESKFVSTIAVYEAEESDYTPLTAEEFRKMDMNGSYILTENFVVSETDDYIRPMGNEFKGVLINPHGYTITYRPKENYLFNIVTSFAPFGTNLGIIDGLKIAYEGVDGNLIVFGQFDALVEYNYGLLKNCNVTGAIDVVSHQAEFEYYQTGVLNTLVAEQVTDEHTRLLPLGGYVQGNKIEMTIYTNGPISPIGSYTSSERNAVVVENNELRLDCYYFSDRLLARRRNAYWAGFGYYGKNNLLCRLDGATADEDGARHMITLKAPYNNYAISAYTGSVMEVPIEYENDIIDFYASYDTSVRYWLVNGKKYDDLNSLVVTGNVEIVPYVKYTETHIDHIRSGEGTSMKVAGLFNADEDVFEIEFDSEEELEYMFYSQGGIFEKFFRDPYNVIPDKIVWGKYFYVGGNRNGTLNNNSSGSAMTAFDASYLRDYIRGGGILEVADGNADLLMLDEHSLCTADGKTLLRYFDDGKTEELTLPNSIRRISSDAFLNDNGVVTLDLSRVEELGYQALLPFANIKKLILGDKIKAYNPSGYNEASLSSVLQTMPSLLDVEISEVNPEYRSENGFVIATAKVQDAEANSVIWYSRRRVGVARIPEGVKAVAVYAFLECSVEEIVFPEGFNTLYCAGLMNCYTLRKLTFNATDSLSIVQVSSDGSNWTPSLEELKFSDDIRYLDISYNAFQHLNLETVSLPSGLQTVGSMLLDCENFEIAKDNEYYCTENGVLYTKDKTNVIAFPRHRNDKVYVAPETVNWVVANAFRNTLLEEVEFGDEMIWIGSYAFDSAEYLKSVKIGGAPTDTQLTIQPAAFRLCGALEKVTFDKPAELLVLDTAFDDCVSLTQFPVEQAVKIGTHAFANTKLTKAVLHDELYSLGSGAFGETLVTEAVIPEGYTGELPYGTFRLTPIEKVDLGGVTELGMFVFAECAALTEIDLKNVTQIGSYAFRQTGLQRAESDAVKGISVGAFADCADLTYASFPNVQVSSIGVFKNSGVTFVSLPKLSMLSDEYFADCTALEEVELFPNLNAGKKAFYNCSSLKTLGDVTLINVTEEVFYGCESLKEVRAVVEDVVLTVEKDAFKGAKALEKVSFQANEVNIKDSVFADCIELKEVWISASLKNGGSIVRSVFDSLPQNVSVYINVPKSYTWSGKLPANVTVYVPKALEAAFEEEWLCHKAQVVGYDFDYTLGYELTEDGSGYAVKNKNNWVAGDLVIPDTYQGLPVVEIGEGVFAYDMIDTLTLGKNVKKIAGNAFYCCETLETIVFPEDSVLKTVEANAFFGCSALKELTLPDSVKEIGASAFYNCSNIKTLTIGAGLTYVMPKAFLALNGLETLYYNAVACADVQGDIFGKTSSQDAQSYTLIVGNGVQRIPSRMFYVSTLGMDGVQNLQFEENSVCGVIGTYAFRNCGMAEVSIPASVHSIGQSAFYACKNLVNVTFEENSSLNLLNSSVFQSCTALESIQLPAGLKQIGNATFNECYSLKEIRFPEGLEIIGANAFNNCDGLKEVVLPDSVTTVQSSAFSACNGLETVTIGKNFKEFGTAIFEECTALHTVYFNAVDCVGRAFGTGCFYNTGMVNIKVVIGKDVKRIPSGFFYSRNKRGPIKYLVFEEGSVCEEIGSYAFSQCSLSDVVLPDSVQSIGSYAFSGCDVLRYLQLGANVKVVSMSAIVMSDTCQDNLKIVVHSAEKPQGWDENWVINNSSTYSLEVVWVSDDAQEVV
ncbi:MAG: leucine-rich repeat protein [Clostridia bacterium]|nr:leucine-rich repeat protein [Clostridia bacterium]